MAGSELFTTLPTSHQPAEFWSFPYLGPIKLWGRNYRMPKIHAEQGEATQVRSGPGGTLLGKGRGLLRGGHSRLFGGLTKARGDCCWAPRAPLLGRGLVRPGSFQTFSWRPGGGPRRGLAEFPQEGLREERWVCTLCRVNIECLVSEDDTG